MGGLLDPHACTAAATNQNPRCSARAICSYPSAGYLYPAAYWPACGAPSGLQAAAAYHHGSGGAGAPAPGASTNTTTAFQGDVNIYYMGGCNNSVCQGHGEE